MEVREIRCYNKELNKFMDFNEHIVDERFMKSTGYRPVEVPKEEPLLSKDYFAGDPETVIPALECCKKETKCKSGKCKNSKKKINAD